METTLVRSENPRDDDPRRLRAAFGYLFTPLVPILNMTGDGAGDRWMRYHSVQALLWSGPFILLLAGVIILMIALVSSNFLFICLLPVSILIPFLPGMYWARKIYLGGEVRVPGISSLVTK
ncbi:MAG: hypothetical protein R3A46_05765 [Thermomicrobiales bacterium]